MAQWFFNYDNFEYDIQERKATLATKGIACTDYTYILFLYHKILIFQIHL